MANEPLHIFFKEHPTRVSTTPWSKVREAAMMEEVRQYVTKAINSKRSKLAARHFGGYRLEFQRTPLQRPDGEEEEIWTVYHSDAEAPVAKRRGAHKVAR